MEINLANSWAFLRINPGFIYNRLWGINIRQAVPHLFFDGVRHPNQMTTPSLKSILLQLLHIGTWPAPIKYKVLVWIFRLNFNWEKPWKTKFCSVFNYYFVPNLILYQFNVSVIDLNQEENNIWWRWWIKIRLKPLECLNQKDFPSFFHECSRNFEGRRAVPFATPVCMRMQFGTSTIHRCGTRST